MYLTQGNFALATQKIQELKRLEAASRLEIMTLEQNIQQGLQQMQTERQKLEIDKQTWSATRCTELAPVIAPVITALSNLLQHGQI